MESLLALMCLSFLKESKYFHSTACAVTSATLISVSAKYNKSGHVCAGIINITILLVFTFRYFEGV